MKEGLGRGEAFYEYFELEAAGQRIGLLTCKRCGSAVILSKEEDAAAIHMQWHERERTDREYLVSCVLSGGAGKK